MTSVDVAADSGADQVADPEPDASADPEAAGPARRSRLGVVLVALLLVAAVFLATSAVLWWRADHDDRIASAETRDVVLVDARQDVAVLTTLDYRTVSTGLKRWQSVSTGTLGKQLGGIDAPTQQALTDAGKVSTGTVLAAALTSLDVGAGTASGVATVEISVRDQSGQTETKRDRFTVDLKRVAGRWLVSSLDQLPVELSQ